MRTLFVLSGLALLTNLGCSKGNDAPPNSSTNSTRNYTIAANCVGDYVVGSSTLAEILGEDTPDARRRFAERGLNFQFDRGVTLTGITVSSADYRLKNGLAVGASAKAIRQVFGEPNSTRFETNKFSVDALVYDDYTFYLNGDTVSAIFVRGGN